MTLTDEVQQFLASVRKPDMPVFLENLRSAHKDVQEIDEFLGLLLNAATEDQRSKTDAD